MKEVVFRTVSPRTLTTMEHVVRQRQLTSMLWFARIMSNLRLHSMLPDEYTRKINFQLLLRAVNVIQYECNLMYTFPVYIPETIGM